MEPNTKKSNKVLFKKHFERVIRRITKRHDDNKNYFDFRRSWPIAGIVWTEDGNAVAINFGHDGFLMVFRYDMSTGLFRATGHVDCIAYFNRAKFEALVDADKSVIQFDIEVTESVEEPRLPALKIKQTVNSKYWIEPDKVRLFGSLVGRFILDASCRELKTNFEVVIEYVNQQAACRKILEMAQAALDRQFEEIKIAWPSITETENGTP